MSDSTTARPLRIHAEYQCWPLWLARGDGGEENPDPREFGLPGELADALAGWSEEFDEAVDPADFTTPVFADPDVAAEFDQRGLILARRTAKALAGQWLVTYSSTTTGKVELSGE